MVMIGSTCNLSFIAVSFDGFAGTTKHNLEVVAMIAKLTLTACMLIFTLPLIGLAKEFSGEIPDRRALAEVRTYCIEKSGLSDSDRYIVDGFLKTESKPKHLLTKMPWKLVESCRDDNPDAIATVDFVPLNTTRISNGVPTGPGGVPAGPPVGGTDARDPETQIKVVLTVGDSSQKLLYRIEAMPLGTDRVYAAQIRPTEPPSHGGPVERLDAVYHVFWRLIKDLQVVRGATAK